MSGGGPAALAGYEQYLKDAYGPYYRIAKAFVHLISNPQTMRLCVGVGMRSEQFMAQLLRIMANLMRPDTLGPAEIGFRLMEAASHLVPKDSTALADFLEGNA